MANGTTQLLRTVQVNCGRALTSFSAILGIVMFAEFYVPRRTNVKLRVLRGEKT